MLGRFNDRILHTGRSFTFSFCVKSSLCVPLARYFGINRSYLCTAPASTNDLFAVSKE